MPVDLRFDLTTPCADCPFRHDVPLHDGVGGDLPVLLGRMLLGTAAHSCHKTDSRSDCESAKSFTGPIQHCAGLMIMLERAGEPSNAMLRAEREGKLDRKKLNMSAPVYRPSGMANAYAEHFEKIGKCV